MTPEETQKGLVDKMEKKKELFSNQELKKMVAPLFGEQLLVMLVGLFDTLVISYAGEDAVSGVSLVNQFNTIFIYLFTALASGGAVVVSQFIGRKEMEHAGESASQLLFFSAFFSVVIGTVVLAGNKAMLSLLFGRVEDSVMEACIIYLKISVYSYPALAVYNSGALSNGLRAAGDVKFTMVVSILSTRLVRLLLSYLLGIVLDMGVMGIAAAMVCDWGIRAVIFAGRLKSGKWKKFQVIA